MANVLIESFDHYTSALSGKWSSMGGSSVVWGRFGRGWNCGNNAAVIAQVPSHATYTVGFASSWLRQQANRPFLDLGGQMGVWFAANSGTGAFLAVRRGNTLLATDATKFISNNTWYYIEFQSTIHSSAGSYELRVDGQMLLSATGINTSNGGSTITTVTIQAGTSGSTDPIHTFDDVYINSGAGSINNSFWGDTRIEALFPSGNGALSDWLGSDGNSTDNYLLVDEDTPNSDTDYVAASMVGATDTYQYSNLSSSGGQVLAVQTVNWVRKDDAGLRTVAPVARIGGTNYLGADCVLSTSYVADIRTFEQNPATSADWTIADVNGAEFGYRVTS